MTSSCLPPLLRLLGCSAILSSSTLAHDHYAAGVVDLNGNQVGNQGEQLMLYGAPSAAKVFHLEGRISGELYAGYHVIEENMTEGFSFTSRFGGFQNNEPAFNAYIWMEITSVTGPAGGHLGFWEAEGDPGEQQPRVFFHDDPSNIFPANQPTGGFKFVLTEQVPGDPDPGGHIHFRAWTVDVPGDYYVGFTLYDLSTAGAGGGPFHTPSQTYTFHFQAVPEPSAAALFGLGGGWFGSLRRRRS